MLQPHALSSCAVQLPIVFCPWMICFGFWHLELHPVLSNQGFHSLATARQIRRFNDVTAHGVAGTCSMWFMRLVLRGPTAPQEKIRWEKGSYLILPPYPLRCFLLPLSPHLGLKITMFQTLVCLILLGDLSSGIPIQISTRAIFRGLQNFKSAMSEREGLQDSQEEICEVEESHYQLNSDVAVAARLCKTTGTHPLLGEGYECVQEYLSLSVFSASVPSGCSLSAVNSIRAQLQPLAEYDPRRQDLELPSGLQIVTEHRFCESMGKNNGNHRLDGSDYSCSQQNLTVWPLLASPAGLVPTPLPSGCACYYLSSLWDKCRSLRLNLICPKLMQLNSIQSI